MTYPARYAIYTGRSTNWPAVIVSLALLVPLATMSKAGLALPLLVVAAVALVNFLTATSIRTATGTNGVSIRFGLLGWPRATYRLEKIARAEVVTLSVWQVAFGFWWTPFHTNCTVRSGPALRLTLHNGRTVTVTVPDAQAAVNAIDEARSPLR